MVTHYLKQHRERARMTQDTLAQKTGTFPSVISRFETGARAISLEMAVRLCTALDIKLTQLIEPPGTPERPSLDDRIKGLKPERIADIAAMVETMAGRFREP